MTNIIHILTNTNHLPFTRDLGTFMNRVECFCALTSSSVTSGFRTFDRNKMAGGSMKSRHLMSRDGWGVDVVPDDQDLLDVRVERKLKTLGRIMGIVVVVEEDHMHIQNVYPGS